GCGAAGAPARGIPPCAGTVRRSASRRSRASASTSAPSSRVDRSWWAPQPSSSLDPLPWAWLDVPRVVAAKRENRCDRCETATVRNRRQTVLHTSFISGIGMGQTLRAPRTHELATCFPSGPVEHGSPYRKPTKGEEMLLLVLLAILAII